jgi:drug/metabolite transporter (DMT)-like permease
VILGLVSALASAALFGVAAVVQAHAMRALPEGELGLVGFVRAAVRSWPMLAVVAAYLGGFVLHAVALLLLPLYLAQASISLSLPVTAVVSAVWLHERLSLARWLAVLAVIAGLVLVAAGAGEVEPTTSTATLLGVGAVWLLVLAIGARLSLARGAGILGAWSGLGYAGSAVTTRGLSADDLLLSALALMLVSALGLVAFWLYSVALGRTDVAASTAPLIVMQTAIPALVGVIAFGDTVRSGWAVVVFAGLALSVAGAIHLGRQPGSEATAPSVRMSA